MQFSVYLLMCRLTSTSAVKAEQKPKYKTKTMQIYKTETLNTENKKYIKNKIE
jgi:hypothetical protein